MGRIGDFKRWVQGFAAILLGLWLILAAASGPALAQGANCNQLNRQLTALNRNADFRDLGSNSAEAQQLAQQLQQAESQFVRQGCQAEVNAGGRLSRECRSLARSILNGRKRYAALKARVDTGQAVDQQREAILLQIARFSCQSRSRATYTEQIRTPQGNDSPFSSFLDRLFGRDDQLIENDDPYFNRSTLRTVCVRSCDGYYWPVSFSTVAEYLPDDAARCSTECPGANVQLYYYHNPGETADQMVNLDGVPYTQLPNAFRYRKEYDPSCACKTKIDYGSITLTGSDQSETGRAMVEINGLSFPLPRRDPRNITKVISASVTYVPLPRPRPVLPGEPGASTQPTADPAFTRLSAATRNKLRLIESHGRAVRIVGPNTPYVQAAEEGS